MMRKINIRINKMLLGLSFFLIQAVPAETGQIILGIKSEYLTVWRFWEQQKDEDRLKILIYNPQDNPITVYLNRKEIKPVAFFKEKKTKKIAGPWKIEPRSFIVRDFPKKPKKHEDVYVEFRINQDVFAGLLDFVDFKPRDLGFNDYIILSPEGINGANFEFWMEYQKLGYSSLDSVLLKLHFNRRKYYHGSYTPGQYELSLSFEKNNLELLNTSFGGNTGHMKRNEDKIELVIPYEREKGKSEKYSLEIWCKRSIVSTVTALETIDAHLTDFEYSHRTKPPGQLQKVLEGWMQIPILYESRI